MELEARDTSQTTNKMNDAFSLLEQLAQWVTSYLCTHHPEGGHTPFLESLLPCMQKSQYIYDSWDQKVQWKCLSLFLLNSHHHLFHQQYHCYLPIFQARRLKHGGLKRLAHNHTTLSGTSFHFLHANELFFLAVCLGIMDLTMERAISDILFGFCSWNSMHTMLGKVDSLIIFYNNRKISFNYHVELWLAIWNVYVSPWRPIIWVAGAVRSKEKERSLFIKGQMKLSVSSRNGTVKEQEINDCPRWHRQALQYRGYDLLAVSTFFTPSCLLASYFCR